MVRLLLSVLLFVPISVLAADRVVRQSPPASSRATKPPPAATVAPTDLEAQDTDPMNDQRTDVPAPAAKPKDKPSETDRDTPEADDKPAVPWIANSNCGRTDNDTTHKLNGKPICYMRGTIVCDRPVSGDPKAQVQWPYAACLLKNGNCPDADTCVNDQKISQKELSQIRPKPLAENYCTDDDTSVRDSAPAIPSATTGDSASRVAPTKRAPVKTGGAH